MHAREARETLFPTLDRAKVEQHVTVAACDPRGNLTSAVDVHAREARETCSPYEPGTRPGNR